MTVISKAVRAPTEHECELLDLEPDDQLLEVERVRLADGRPVIYSRDRIPAALLRGIPDDALDSSLYVILETAGHAVVRASAELLPTLADERALRTAGGRSAARRCCTSIRSTTTRAGGR